MDVVRRHFRPEFLNRIDEIILFKRLGRGEMDNIVRIQLQRVEKLLGDRRMSIALDDSALHWLGERGYDPVYGARPLKRVIQKELSRCPSARKLLAGDLEDGAVIDVTADQDGLVIGRAKVHYTSIDNACRSPRRAPSSRAVRWPGLVGQARRVT